jgi:hypothetical protein
MPILINFDITPNLGLTAAPHFSILVGSLRAGLEILNSVSLR